MYIHRLGIAGVTAIFLVLTGCWSGDTLGPTSPAQGVGGLVGYGAPIVEGRVTVLDANGAPVNSMQTSKQGEWKFELKGDEKDTHPYPWLLKGEATGVPTVWSIVFENEVGDTTQSVNINPFTTATLVLAGVKVGDGTLDASDLASLKMQTQNSIATTGQKLTSILVNVLAKLPSPPPNGNVFEL